MKDEMNLSASLRQIIRDNRRSTPFRLFAAGCEKYLRAWYNEAFYDFKRNGEAFAMAAFARWCPAPAARIWDVGAHTGEWALAMIEVMPQATIHSFEIVPSVREALRRAVAGCPRIIAEESVISDRCGTVPVYWNESFDDTSSISTRVGSRFFRNLATVVECPIITADLFSERTAIPAFIKIDVEGHETSVLMGAQNLLASDRPPVMIQIEYGDTYIPSGSTLRNLYSILAPRGYDNGRLYPNHVEFKAYEFSDDNFRMGNIITVRDDDLRAMLS
jgi:FkbM family methyltransferase